MLSAHSSSAELLPKIDFSTFLRCLWMTTPYSSVGQRSTALHLHATPACKLQDSNQQHQHSNIAPIPIVGDHAQQINTQQFIKHIKTQSLTWFTQTSWATSTQQASAVFIIQNRRLHNSHTLSKTNVWIPVI